MKHSLLSAVIFLVALSSMSSVVAKTNDDLAKLLRTLDGFEHTEGGDFKSVRFVKHREENFQKLLKGSGDERIRAARTIVNNQQAETLDHWEVREALFRAFFLNQEYELQQTTTDSSQGFPYFLQLPTYPSEEFTDEMIGILDAMKSIQVPEEIRARDDIKYPSLDTLITIIELNRFPLFPVEVRVKAVEVYKELCKRRYKRGDQVNAPESSVKALILLAEPKLMYMGNPGFPESLMAAADAALKEIGGGKERIQELRASLIEELERMR